MDDERNRTSRRAEAVPAEQSGKRPTSNIQLPTPRDAGQALNAEDEKREALFAALDQWYAKKQEELAAQQGKVLLGLPSRGEVFGAIQGVVKGIQERFASREEIGKALGAALQDINGRNFVTLDQAQKIAREAVPSTLRGLDSAGDKRPGDTLMLAVGGASGKDAAYWGRSRAGGGIDFSKVALGYTVSGKTVTVLAGAIDQIAVAQTPVTVENNYYIYIRRTLANNTMLVASAASVPANDATYAYYRLYKFSVAGEAPNEVATCAIAYRPFDIDGIKVPFGTAEAPHLIWNAATGAWGTGLIETDLPEGGDQYMVLQRDGSGDAVWDWTRWIVEVT